MFFILLVLFSCQDHFLFYASSTNSSISKNRTDKSLLLPTPNIDINFQLSQEDYEEDEEDYDEVTNHYEDDIEIMTETSEGATLENLIEDEVTTVKPIVFLNKILDISGNFKIQIKNSVDKIVGSLSNSNEKHLHPHLWDKIQQYLVEPVKEKIHLVHLSLYGGFLPSKPLVLNFIKDKLDKYNGQFTAQINSGYYGGNTPPPPPYLWQKFWEKKQAFLNHFGWNSNYDYPYPYRSLRIDNITRNM